MIELLTLGQNSESGSRADGYGSRVRLPLDMSSRFDFAAKAVSQDLAFITPYATRENALALRPKSATSRENT